MRRWISLAVATTLTGCVSADAGGPSRDRAPAFAHDQCFRAADVTNYNIEAPHALFVLTRRGYVFGLISEDCFRDNAATIALAQSRRADLWLCAGDQAEVQVGKWRGRVFPCMAHVTSAIVDADLSGFRARAQPG